MHTSAFYMTIDVHRWPFNSSETRFGIVYMSFLHMRLISGFIYQTCMYQTCMTERIIVSVVLSSFRKRAFQMAHQLFLQVIYLCVLVTAQ